ncbi:MAG: carboxyltransferase [Actinomycetota bacterium]
MSTVEFIDQTLRDGQQSWWGMRMRLGHALPIAPDLDRVGYHAVDIAGSSIFEVQVRYCREDPWEYLSALSAAMPRSRLRAGTRSNGIVTFGLTPDSVMDLWVRRLVAHGMSSFWIYDGLFNIDKVARLTRVAKGEGAEVVPCILFANSPVHTDEYYAAKAKELAALGPDGIYFEDAAGVLTPERARTLFPAILGAIEGLPLELHLHNNGTMAPLCYLEGIRLGAARIHTAARPLANGVSHPSVEMMLKNIRASGHDAALDETAFPRIADHLVGVAEGEGWPVGTPAEYDVTTYQHQLPGGMTGTMLNQLRERGMAQRLDDVLTEMARIREELGYPVMATPFSQLVGTQAVLNVTTKERYEIVPDEVLFYVCGHYGEPVGQLDPEVLDRIMSSPRAKEFVNYEPPQPSLDELRRQMGTGLDDDELLLRLLVNEEDIAAMRAAGPARRDYPIPRSPEVRLLKKLLAHASGSHVHLETPDMTVRLGRTR